MKNKIISCTICGKKAEIFPDGMPFCFKCHRQLLDDSWRDEIKRNVETLEQHTSVDDVIDRVCRINGLNRADLLRKTREKDIVEARHMCMCLIRMKFCFTYKKIGKIFNQDHATALYAYREIGNRIAKYKSFRKKYSELLK